MTGASTGIGEQLAYQYASLGCHVVVTSRRFEALMKVRQQLVEDSMEENQRVHVQYIQMSGDINYSQSLLYFIWVYIKQIK